jgi:hypothetical protein
MEIEVAIHAFLRAQESESSNCSQYLRFDFPFGFHSDLCDMQSEIILPDAQLPVVLISRHSTRVLRLDQEISILSMSYVLCFFS